MFKTVTFIGGGRITRILLQGLKHIKELPEKIIVCEPDEKVLNQMKNMNIPGLELTPDNHWEGQAELIFLAVHPPVVKEVMPELKKLLNPESILISLVPVIQMSALSKLADGFDRIVRMIPNAPSVIGEGYNPVCFSDSISGQEKRTLSEWFSKWGKSPVVGEDSLEGYAIITAMGPTYFWFQWLELFRLAQEFNISKEEATDAICSMIDGAARLLFKSGIPSEDVLDLIPVRPLQENEEEIRVLMYTKLSFLHSKLTARK